MAESRSRVRAQSSDFVRMMVQKAAEKEEPTQPYDNKADTQQIEELVKQLKEQQKPKSSKLPNWTKKIKP
ncbi:MAG: hypothetical protein QW063_02105 [Candidatus Nanoarchaeia archaeon]